MSGHEVLCSLATSLLEEQDVLSRLFFETVILFDW